MRAVWFSRDIWMLAIGSHAACEATKAFHNMRLSGSQKKREKTLTSLSILQV